MTGVNIGWEPNDSRERFELTMPIHDLMELLQRLHGEAAQVLIESGAEAQASREDAETKRRFQLGHGACEEFGEDLRLMEGIGWVFESDRDLIALTMTRESLAATLKRLRRDARRAPSEKRHEREAEGTDEERWQRFRRAVDTCERLLASLGSAAPDERKAIEARGGTAWARGPAQAARSLLCAAQRRPGQVPRLRLRRRCRWRGSGRPVPRRRMRRRRPGRRVAADAAMVCESPAKRVRLFEGCERLFGLSPGAATASAGVKGD